MKRRRNYETTEGTGRLSKVEHTAADKRKNEHRTLNEKQSSSLKKNSTLGGFKFVI